MGDSADEGFGGGTLLDIAPGSTLGRYELLVPIAAGGMARVWAARLRGHAGFSKLVAIKMILPELAEDAGFQQMFLDEARIASMVRHPNVCETYDLAETRGILYLAMEWVDGASLLRLLRPGAPSGSEPGASSVRQPIAPRIVARIIANACAGLHAAHELVGDDGTPLSVVHRDATPHNLLIAADGRVKVSDFGVAKALGQSHATLSGQIKGKVPYMSPEQLCGEQIDRRADIFALGACLYEAVTGKKAFAGENDPEVMSNVVLGRFEPPSAVSRDVPAALEEIIMTAMQLVPADRFPTAEVMQGALEQYISESGPPVMSSAVAAVVKARCGPEIEQRRDNVRAACISPIKSEPPAPEIDVHVTGSVSAGESAHDTLRHPGPAAPPPFPRNPAKSDASGQMNGAMDLGRARGTETARWGLLVAIAGMATLIGIGTGGLVFVKLTGGDRAVATADSLAGKPPASVASNEKVQTAPIASGKASSLVTFHVTPAAAILIVDGVVLPRGTTILQRATDGSAQNVLIRADKYEDYLVLVDPETPADVEVALSPLGAPRKIEPRLAPSSSASSAVGVVASAAASGAPSSSASSAASAGPPRSAVESIPNPYGGE